MKLSLITREDYKKLQNFHIEFGGNRPSKFVDVSDITENNLLIISEEILGNFRFDEDYQNLFEYKDNETKKIVEVLLADDDTGYKIIQNSVISALKTMIASEEEFEEEEEFGFDEIDIIQNYDDEYPVDEFDGYLHANDFENEEDLSDGAMSMYCLNSETNEEFTVYFLDGQMSHAYDMNGDNYDVDDEFITYLESKLVDAFNEFPEDVEEKINSATQYIQQKVQEAQEAQQIVTESESDKETAKRLNITEDQLRTLRNIPEKTRMSLKTPQSTLDRDGKRAKSKVVKMVTFNDSFEKGMVFMEYPHLKGWLAFSMGASEFFRKVNVRLKK